MARSYEWHSSGISFRTDSILHFFTDLPISVSVKSDVLLFADDTKIYRRVESDADIDVIQDDLDSLFEWSVEWTLRFHPD